jgi:hypothetical protein
MATNLSTIYIAVYYQEAAANFNAKNYQSAFTGFVNAIMVSTFMTEKKMDRPGIGHQFSVVRRGGRGKN